MKTELNYGDDFKTGYMRFQGLLYRQKDGSINGAMAPVMAAQIISRENNFPIHGLVRVLFDNPEVNNRYEGPGRRECLTGCDTLMLLSIYTNCKQVVMFIDQGSDLLPIGLKFDNDDDLAVLTPIYLRAPFEVKLDAAEVTELINSALAEDAFKLKGESV